MSSTALELGEFDLPERNRLAAAAIERYAVGHAFADAAIGLGGFLAGSWGGDHASIIRSMLVQVPIYKSLALGTGPHLRIALRRYRQRNRHGPEWSSVRPSN